MTAKSHPRRHQRGNAILMLFAAVGMAGVVTYGLNNILRGPAVTTAELSRRTIAENNMIASTRLAVAGAVRSQANKGDCDRDGFVEPLPFRTGSPAPAGGGLLPMTMGASLSDPWGTQFGYCVWDPGTLSKSDSVAACGGAGANRLEGAPRDDQPAIAIISAGKNGAFETTCAAFADTAPADGRPDAAMLNKPPTSDDIVQSYTYAEANGIGSGEWKLNAAGTTAEVAKDLEVKGGASFIGALDTSQGGLVLPQDPGDDSVTGACTAAKDQQLRLNMATDPPSLEMCNMAGTGWTVVSGGGAAPTVYPSCFFPKMEKVLRDTSFTEGAYTYGNNSFSMRYGGVRARSFDPNAPGLTLVGSGTYDGDIPSVFANGYMYSVDEANDRVGILDVSNPAAMVKKTSVSNATLLDTVTSLAVYKNYLVAMAYSPRRLTVIDVANPNAPTIVGSLQDNAKFQQPDKPVVIGDYAYVFGNGWLNAVDLTNPAAPVLVGSISGVSQSRLYPFKNYLIGHSERGAYSRNVITVDVSNPAVPAVVGTLDLSAYIPNNITYITATLVGKYMFLTSSSHIVILDLTDPLNIVVAQTYPITDIDPGYFPSVRGHYLQTAGGSGQDIFNIGCNPLTGAMDESLGAEGPASNDPLDKGMIAHWKMDEGSGTAVADSSGNGNNGVFVNTPQWIKGPVGGGGLSFSAADRDAVQVSGLLGSPATGTISLWVNIEKQGTSLASAALSFGNNVNLELSEARGVALVYNAGTYIIQTNESIVGGGWHYVTATFDDPNNVFRVYVDGVLKAQQNYAGAMSYSGQGSNTFFGRHGNGNTGFDLTGGVDDLRVYSRAFGPAEARALYDKMRSQSSYGRTADSTVANNFQHTRISTSYDGGGVCGIRADGGLACWGQDNTGQLGNGSGQGASDTPYRIDANRYNSVSAGAYYGCAIRVDGTLWCWGYDSYGNIGIGGPNLTTYQSPVQVGTALWSQISAGTYTCGIRSDSTLWCWGANNVAQLGQGDFTNRSSPVQVAGSWSFVAAGITDTCGIKTDGTAWCWGLNDNGRLGLGTSGGYQTTPAMIQDPGPWASISVGGEATCGVKRDGSGWCWGKDTGGLLGNGPAAADQLVPTPISSMRRFSTIDVGVVHACGLGVDGSAWCWGNDGDGWLGNGALTGQKDAPSRVTGDGWAGISAGRVTCGIKADGNAFCWGPDGYGELGNGIAVFADQTAPYPVSNFLQPAMMAWNDDQTIIAGNPGFNLALNGGVLSATNASFGFDGRGKALLNQTSSGNQLLVSTAAAGITPQVSFKTAPGVGGDVAYSLPGCWAFDETSGTTAASPCTGAAINGTVMGGAAWVPDYGRNGGALNFDGIDDYVTVPDNAVLKPAAVTVAAWVRKDAPTASLANYIVTKAYNNNASLPNISYALTLQGDHPAFAIGYSTGASFTQILAPATVPYGEWVYLVGVYDPAAAAPQMNLYVNGTLTQSATLSSSILYGTTPLRIGEGGFASPGGLFKGLIDDARVYNRGMSAPEVTAMYNYQTSLFQTPRTIGINTSDNLIIGRNNAGATNWTNAVTPDLAVSTTGLVGVGTAAPVAKVDVNGGVRIGADYECSVAAHAGKVRYIGANTPPWQYCNGSSWATFTNMSTIPWQSNGRTISAGNTHTCAIKGDGTLWCWGYNTDGYLGNNTTTSSTIPAQVHSSSSATGWTDWVNVTTSLTESADTGQDGHTCGVRANGTAWCWGLAELGRLGEATTTPPKLRPVQVKDSAGSGTWSDWMTVSAGDVFTCGLRTNGTAWCWGGRENGRLGDGSSAGDIGTPVQVKDSAGTGTWSDWVQIESGMEASCGLRNNGTAWCWGEGYDGQLGYGSNAGSSLPVQVKDSAGTGTWSDWIKISKGYSHVCGLRANGEAWCWGADWDAALGDATCCTTRNLPVRVQTDTGPGGWTDWIDIQAGVENTCGIRSSGTLWCWGNGIAIGWNSGTGQSGRPYAVHSDTSSTGFTDWASVSAGYDYNCGVRTNGLLYCWGDDTPAGRLGTGPGDADRLRPYNVP